MSRVLTRFGPVQVSPRRHSTHGHYTERGITMGIVAQLDALLNAITHLLLGGL